MKMNWVIIGFAVFVNHEIRLRLDANATAMIQPIGLRIGEVRRATRMNDWLN